MQQVFMSTVTSLGAAELLLVLVRTREIVIITKAPNQRAAKEQTEIDRGLIRSVVLEALLFVPVSVILLCLTVRPVLADSGFLKLWAATHPIPFEAMIGLISYGFPFAMIRRLVTTIALQTLKNFAEISIKEDDSRPNRGSSSARPSRGAE